MNTLKYKNANCTINSIETTDNLIHGRGGLVFILKYIANINLFSLFEKFIPWHKKRSNTHSVSFILRQIMAYFIDGSQKSISGFDQLKTDKAYASLLEVNQSQLLSSHSVKRFLRKCSYLKSLVFRKILNQLFIWRLKVVKPNIIIFDMDTMVLNNDDAQQREGVSPTYKNLKGFQPLQITWEGFVVDAHFRRGSAHSNHGTDVQKAMKNIVDLIRNNYRDDVPIIITCDSGFLDEKNLHFFQNELKIGFICFGKLYDSIKDYVQSASPETFQHYDNGHKIWQYLEYGSKLKSWKDLGFLRTIFTTSLCDENGQMLLEIVRPDSVLYTNIGCNNEFTQHLIASGNEEFLNADRIIEYAHRRGQNELCNRSLKDFMTSETLPFKRFGMNSAYYYLMAISHFVLQAYKEDVVKQAGIEEIQVTSYPSTVRRRLIDFAVQIVKTGNTIKVMVMRSIWERLKIENLWSILTGRCLIPIPPIG